jgi:CRP-like cAMP-binding protein
VNTFKTYLNALTPLSETTWAKIQALFTEKTLKKGDFFAKNGEKAVYIGFLKSGVVRAFYTNEEGVEYNKHFFTPNALVGAYASLITGNPNLIAQQALTNCEMLVAEYAKMTELYATCPDLERMSRRYAELSYVYKEAREIELVLLDAEQRYAIFQNQYPDLEQLITQYHIASFLGVSATQLSRIRRKMSQK